MNGEPYWSKPPLFHVSVGAAMRATGSREEWPAKAVAALWGVLLAAATAALSEVLLGPGRGLLAAAVLLSTHYVLLRYRMATTDTAFAALTTLSLLGFSLARRTGRAGGWVLMGAAAGLAVWAKALHGLLFPFLAAGALLAARREGGAIRGRGFLLALLLGAAVAGAWLLVLLLGEGGGAGMVGEFLLGNAERRFGEDAHHAEPFYHYLGLLPLLLPWTPAAAAGGWAAVRGAPEERERLLGPLLWVGTMVLALSIPSGKRSVYLLPVLPGAALLAAGAVDAAARGALAGVPLALARWPVEILSLPFRWTAWARSDLRRRAMAAAALCAAGSTVYLVASLGPRTEATSGAPLAREAARIAGDRPLVLFRLGQGEVGQFLFPLGRTLPSAFDEADLRRIAGRRPVVLLTRAEVPESAARNGRISPELLARWTPVGGGLASGDPYVLYEWDGR